MDFQDIHLSFSEIRLLKKAQKRHQPSARYSRLLRLRLVEEIFESLSPGSMPVPNGNVAISPRGSDYLAYLSGQLQIGYIRPMVVSFLTSLATSAAVHWLWPMLQQIPERIAKLLSTL